MPRIFDNIEPDQILYQELQQSIQEATRADFCVGYFNLRGWGAIADSINTWRGTPDNRVRVLVGMQSRPEDEFREAMRQMHTHQRMDSPTAVLLKRKLAEEFRAQLTVGVPTNADERTLQQLARQLKAGQVVVKLYLASKLHAKLYLLHRDDRRAPIIGFVGSSNLTMAGLVAQGELNVEVADSDATPKLAKWFEDRWDDKWALDISEDLLAILNESWAKESLTSPYHIYVKMAYHLSQEARTGLNEFSIPKMFQGVLFDYQEAAVKVAAHHLHQRHGVLIGDVVGLGKTLMATTLARMFEDDFNLETLILCPPNLASMWQREYVDEYKLRAKVLPISLARKELSELPRYRIVIIDESHNLRNREGKTYAAIKDYLTRNDSYVILLSATPYNKAFMDLSNQLRLFVPEDKDLGVRPEALLRELGEAKFNQQHQKGARTLGAFEKSDHADDWRELMRLYMIRRTRSFIQENYAQADPVDGRRYLTYKDRETGEERRSYFPRRTPRTLKFEASQAHDQYSALYSKDVVEIIRHLQLPRYGLGQYVDERASKKATPAEQHQLANLSRAGKRLIGFSRTNLFKRLESSGAVFLQSVERHILRNAIYIYALEHGLPLPIGTQDIVDLDKTNLDTGDLDFESVEVLGEDGNIEQVAQGDEWEEVTWETQTVEDVRATRASRIYERYQNQYATRFRWIPSRFFVKELLAHLKEDADALQTILGECGVWLSSADEKLNLLENLLKHTHANEKVIVFSQFSDTVKYLERELQRRGVRQLKGVTGSDSHVGDSVRRFSPRSNRKKVAPEDELRVLIATDVLSEGQNLQDAHIVVNYDIAWAIIRLIQRAGRVDRIGQQAQEILCYSFVPADGVERIIRLRERVRTRLKENAEVVGTDERFFEDEEKGELYDLYSEKAGVLDEVGDGEVDLASYALEIWNKAIERDPSLKGKIEKMSFVSYGTRAHIANPQEPEGVLVYLRTGNDNDLLAWVDRDGKIISESQFTILNAARCAPETPALPRGEYHHEAVERAVQAMLEAQQSVAGGQLGRPSSARYKTYQRIKAFADKMKGTLFAHEYEGLEYALEEIYKYPLTEHATETLNRQMRLGVNDEDLATLVMGLRDNGRLCVITQERNDQHDSLIVCSLGLLTV